MSLPLPPHDLAERVGALHATPRTYQAAYEATGAATRTSLDGLVPDGWD